eukprot:131414-Hanusia_phi.AAC.5
MAMSLNVPDKALRTDECLRVYKTDRQELCEQFQSLCRTEMMRVRGEKSIDRTSDRMCGVRHLGG